MAKLHTFRLSLVTLCPSMFIFLSNSFFSITFSYKSNASLTDLIKYNPQPTINLFVGKVFEENSWEVFIIPHWTV